MIIRRQFTNPMLTWRVMHALRLWIVVRTAVILFAWVFAPSGSLLPVGLGYAVVIAMLTTFADWLDELRFSIRIVYANLGYGTATMRCLAFFTALAAEAVFALTVRAWR